MRPVSVESMFWKVNFGCCCCTGVLRDADSKADAPMSCGDMRGDALGDAVRVLFVDTLAASLTLSATAPAAAPAPATVRGEASRYGCPVVTSYSMRTCTGPLRCTGVLAPLSSAPSMACRSVTAHASHFFRVTVGAEWPRGDRSAQPLCCT